MAHLKEQKTKGKSRAEMRYKRKRIGGFVQGRKEKIGKINAKKRIVGGESLPTCSGGFL